MKTYIYSLVLFALLSSVLFPQYDSIAENDFTSNLTELFGSSFPSTSEMPLGGKHKTASGTLRVLVVFVRFADDNVSTGSWPNPSVLPSWAANFVNPIIPSNKQFYSLNLSDLFNRASGGDNSSTLGSFNVIGDVYYVVTDNIKSLYSSDYEVTRHVLDKLDSMGVNFKNYDNWQFEKNNVQYQHEYKPGIGDGIVDQIFFLWREPSLSLNAGGYMPLPIGSWPSNDGVLVLGGSGTMTFSTRSSSPPSNVHNPAHEYIHYLFGGTSNCNAHFDGYSHSQGCSFERNRGLVNSFSLMCAVNAGSIGAYERYRLGWIQPVIFNSTGSIVLNDTHVKNHSGLIPIRYDKQTGWLKEFYLIENYHTIRDYAGANPFIVENRFMQHLFTHGLLIFHIEEQAIEYPCETRINILCADGKWTWKLLQGELTPLNRSDDLFGRDVALRYGGFDERQDITISVGGIIYNDYVCLRHQTVPSMDGARYNSDDQLGDVADYFDKNYNEVLNRYSNPATYYYNSTTPIEVGFHIASYNPTSKQYTLNIKVGYNDVLQMPPSKPQNLRVTQSTGTNHPLLTWQPNIEPDLSHYVVEKYITSEWDWQFLGTSSGSSYIDISETYGGRQQHYVSYRVKAIDGQYLYSVPSDTVRELVAGAGIEKSNDNKNNTLNTYSLFDNFPNPFNPTTTIMYQIKESGHVKIKIHDILGKEIMVLVDDYVDAGTHQILFNAVNLPSGVYLYSIQVNDFYQTKKMNLLK